MTASDVAASPNVRGLVNPANAVTAARAFAAPVLVGMIVWQVTPWFLLAAWIVLGATDSVDGWLARRHGATASGAFLDPLADKFLVLGALAAIAIRGELAWLPVILLSVREVFISLYRWLLASSHGKSLPARHLGKAKTVVQLFAVGLVFLPPAHDHLPWLASDLLWLAVVLAWVSAVQYLMDTSPHARWGRG